MLNWKKLWTQWRSPQTFRLPWRRRNQKGLTLIELLVSSLLISVVMLIAWSGLISLMNMSAVSEAKGLREIEVNKALDFLSAEIRTARRVNATATGQLNASTSLATLLQNDGFDLNRLGNYGDLVLYLEIPSAATPPAICPVGGPNAGSPPPKPSDYDQVIYDVRTSPSEWLSPKATMRYGRVKDDNGVFNPCDNPVGSDPVADALSDDVADVPTCPGILTGGPGFYTCQEQEQTNLLLQNKLVDDSVQQTSMVSTPRLETIQPMTVADVGCHNESTLRSLNSDSAPIPYTFFNRRSTSVNLYWLDVAATKQLYATIPANGQFPASSDPTPYFTYLTHPWVIEDNNGVCLQVVVPESEDSEFNVVIPPESYTNTNIQQAPEIVIDPIPLEPDYVLPDGEVIPLGRDYVAPDYTNEPGLDGQDGSAGLDGQVGDGVIYR